MDNNEPLQTIEPKMTNRRHQGVATFVVFLTAMLIGVALMYSPRWGTPDVLAPETKNEMSVSGPTMNESEPVRLRIPSINLDTNFSAPLGLEDGGEIEVPNDYTSVAYYKFGPTPGELGPAVILGHVDSVKGPAVFFSLGQLKEGDEIQVERADGSVATFAVTELERQTQTAFPTRKVYGDIDHAGLRLITCTGIYDKEKLRYTHNLIVYAKLVSTTGEKKE
ncbi:MAG: hypothetical protein RLZZ480_859 [Candidatus Parcubacteria bacterium]|jgi:LPXTG-site transpeptidase (sortase) family protein